MLFYDPATYIRINCNRLNISLSRLCYVAGVPRKTIYNWENKTPSCLIQMGKIERVFMRSTVLAPEEIAAQVEAILIILKSDPVKEAEFINRLLRLMADYK